MTVMVSNTREIDINRLVLTAYQYAGVINEMATADGPQWLAKSAYGRTHLELIVDALGAVGVFERHVEFYDLAVTAGSATVELPSDTIDVIGDAMFAQEGAGDFRMAPITREGYQALTIKTQAGMPVQFYLQRSAPMVMHLWPVPETDSVIKLQRQKLSFDNSSGTATVDLERYWLDYLLNELAYRVAMSNGISVQRCQMFEGKAREAKYLAQGKSGSQLPNQIVVDHRGPWR